MGGGVDGWKLTWRMITGKAEGGVGVESDSRVAGAGSEDGRG